MEEWMKYFGVEVEDARYKQLGLPGSVPLGLIQQKVKWFYKVVALNGSVLQTANLMSCTINVQKFLFAFQPFSYEIRNALMHTQLQYNHDIINLCEACTLIRGNVCCRPNQLWSRLWSRLEIIRLKIQSIAILQILLCIKSGN